MSRDKQISEMAKDINIADHKYCNGRCIGCEHKPKRIEDCACIDIAIATGLTDKGYVKASDLAEEIFTEIDKEIRSYYEAIDIFNTLAELKKKYTKEK